MSNVNMPNVSMPSANIYCGQNVMVNDDFTKDNNDLLRYCPGTIKRIINTTQKVEGFDITTGNIFYSDNQISNNSNNKSNSENKNNSNNDDNENIENPVTYYEIERSNGNLTLQTRINDNFFVEDKTNLEEYSNYKEKQEQIYSINTIVSVNENINLNQYPSYVQALIISEDADKETYTLKIIKNNKILENINIKDIYTACDIVPDSYLRTVNEIIEEKEDKPITQPTTIESECENTKIFSTDLFIKRRKDLFGYILISLSIITFLIILFKIKFISNFEFLEKYKNIILSIFSISAILFVLLLLDKTNLNIFNLGVFISIILFIWGLSWFFKNQENTYFYTIFNKENPTDIENIIKLIWLFIFSLSLGPFFIVIYLVFFVPNSLFKLLKYPQYALEMDKYFYGQIPGLLGKNVTLYILIIIIFIFIYFYLISYLFDGYTEVSQKNKDNYLSDNPIVKLNETANNTIKFISKYLFEFILSFIFILYIIFNYIIPNKQDEITYKFLFVCLIIFIVLYIVKTILINIISNNIIKNIEDNTNKNTNVNIDTNIVTNTQNVVNNSINNTQNVVNKYWLEFILISIFILYIILKYIIPNITFIKNKLPNFVALLTKLPAISYRFVFIYLFLCILVYIIRTNINNIIDEYKKTKELYKKTSSTFTSFF